MTVNYTTNLALGQPVTGTESGTWGDDVNNSVTAYLDIAIAGGLPVTITTTDVTLTNTQGTSSATNIGSTTAQYAILNVSGAMTAARNLIVPSSSKSYIINNSTTGGYTLTVKGAATTGVGLVNGEKALIAWNGTDYVKVATSTAGSGTVTSVAQTFTGGIVSVAGSPVTSSGTLALTVAGTSGGVPYFSSASTWATSAALAANALVIGGGAGAAPATTTTGTGVVTALGVNVGSAGAFTTNNAANTFTATQTFNGSSSTFGTVLLNAAETTTVSATAATGTINYYVNSQSVLYYTSNASANWTLNVAFSAGTSLNTALATGQTVTVVFMVTQGATAYYESVFQIDGTNVTPKWQGGTAPSAGNASSVDVYTYAITKTASATYTVLASQTKFA